MSDDYDVIVLGGGAPGEHCRGCDRRRGVCALPSSSATWSAVCAPTGPASHRSRCCDRARQCTARREAAADSRGRRAGRARLARLHGLQIHRYRGRAMAGRPGDRAVARSRSPCRDRSSRGRWRALHGRGRRARQRRRSVRPAGTRLAGARRRVGHERGDRDEGGAETADRARRRSGRAWSSPKSCVASVARWRSSRAQTTYSRASRRRWAKRWPRRSVATGSSWRSAYRRRGLPRRRRTSCCGWTTGESCAAIICWWLPDAARASRGSASRPSASKPIRMESRSIRSMRVGERLWAIGDVTGDLAAHARRRVPGRDRRLEHPRRAS